MPPWDMINGLNLKATKSDWIFLQQESQQEMKHGESQHWDLLWYVDPLYYCLDMIAYTYW